ncbi:peptide chain release factor 3 [Cylindrospermopsis raciborskii S07]|jgi:peptide chain release factor 3|uniref:Peptide chain release factor 3 n=2 Tax=Cylindrospermopsis raciborskii TaxID=77022 RepID=A0A838WFW9_9CYAN|nr:MULTISPECIES: peptide chain release factor 3 [Cylindrospermopsis]MBU6345310.1 peptide chain release factor 3 [Cyanobacteria bacterium REEB494]KRH96675.1 peptide chain release factor 3 [Cylindrospermopsis sp. CR12]MBA4445363.1 peptide chain release factor 3 [Cylindrospermopsis raciborskii CS-506_C]MBA4449600.1 peptide chain release factor 3 [Cylindrospermopsis raciborskii CS-506_D]MBA4456222.1 peptide chain release factor 3 [Cylindrospermopsis raciborskii CS-506_B]
MTIELTEELSQAVEQRRNFAIISHPDAGKTTLTEKLLLYGGAIHEAGAVKARRDQRKVTSDWMAMEQQRGISITSTVLQFVYHSCQINLLDTPGHQDFSEDTYRTLAAADNAVMLIDAAKGLEPQTRKLFEVCKLRGIPIFTFVNKLDRPGREPLELLDEIEQELGLQTYAVNWPIGMGDRFKGVFDRNHNQIHLFERSAHGSKEARSTMVNLGDAKIQELLDQDLYHQLKDELELLEGAGEELDLDLVHQGKMTPIFFGSAMTNFGVELFLKCFLEYALKPGDHHSSAGKIAPTYPEFTGFVFKLQANMDPKHRDRVAFVRVCTGKFEKDMTVNHARTGKAVRLSRPQKLFAQERESIDVAYPGDVIGLNNPGVFAIGDTIYTGQKLEYEGIPYFSPELFATLRNPNPSKFKQFQKGVSELREEGAVQIMYSTDEAKRDPILAAVGQLQFEVVQFRLQNEYGVETILDLLPYTVARWVDGGWDTLNKVGRLFNTITVKDSMGRPVLLFRNEWNCQQLQGDHPELKLSSIAPVFSAGQTVE